MIVAAHHDLPFTRHWGAGTSSSSDGQFFRSGKRGGSAGEVNARYGVDPGFSFYTHVSDLRLKDTHSRCHPAAKLSRKDEA